ncbi:hypothetical protein BDA96_07G186800 [Sorghum bicolor]|uniref:Uncharacterized protein n=1 Tax=Sorghum bicolor TaxID=4558 RepID=A0A921QNX9_SORBI|nr:hypothetical protein BDA96_07G186800 [Sorghum bicolor]
MIRMASCSGAYVTKVSTRTQETCQLYKGSMFRWTGFAPSNVALMKEIEVWARLNKVLLLALKSSVQLFAVELG